MPLSHKRHSRDRELTAYAPQAACYACYDTGIVSNSDGLVWQYVPDYDITLNGQRVGGSDLAIICHCVAAYESVDHQSNTTRGGLRTSTGPNVVDCAGFQQQIGILIDKDATREIHRRRKEIWQQSIADLNALRQQATSGAKPELPYYIEEVKLQLRELPNLIKSLRK